MNISNLVYCCLAIVLLGSGCISFDAPYESIPPGLWRGTLYIDGKENIQKEVTMKEVRARKMKDVDAGELPFMFEVSYDENEKVKFTFINGEERIEDAEVLVAKDLRIAKDTIVVHFPIYDSYIRATVNDRVMQGIFYKKKKNSFEEIPFEAFHGKNYHFSTINNQPEADFSGKWAVTFGAGTDSPYPAIGEFKQEGANVTGTFRTETGDYRYLSGQVVKGRMYLSCFNGSHLFLFEGRMQGDTVLGTFMSGKNYRTTWTAHRDENAVLRSPDSLTYLNEGFDKLNFSFPNTKGNSIDLNDERFEGKAKIIQILGTWCPNCKDETEFLVDYLQKKPNPNLAVIGLAFEHSSDEKTVFKKLDNYKEKLNVPYELLWAGSSNKKEAAKALPMLNHIMSFPTTIFLNKNNEVVKIHTGFNGPATSKYKDFVKEFESTVNEIIQ